MNIFVNELYYLLPEFVLSAAAVWILVFDACCVSSWKWLNAAFAKFSLIVATVLLFCCKKTGVNLVFNSTVILDNLSVFLKCLILLMAFGIFVYSRRYLAQKSKLTGEYFALCLFSMVGMLVLVSANSFLVLYLGLELMALPLYALIALFRENTLGSEAAIKYFVMGALTSGMLLYGISLIYGETGSFAFLEVTKAISLQMDNPNLSLLFGLMFVLVSIAFKFAVAPFHLWLPDVYEGSPISVTLFIGTLPKLAAFGFAVRLLTNALAPLSAHWQILLLILAVLSLIVGNFGAITQTNIRRLLGYSTIAHMGFLFFGLFIGADIGFSLALNYIVIYALMALGALGVLTLLSQSTKEIELIKDLQGLGATHPGLAFVLMLLLLSLAGIPPLAGFYVKFFIIQALIESGYLSMAIFAVLMTVIGLYYYLKIIKTLYFESPLAGNAKLFLGGGAERFAIALNGGGILALGLFPNTLYTLCRLVF